jgi:hypothetical protein
MTSLSTRPAHRNTFRAYTKAECAYIKANYQNTPKADILAALPGRNWFAIAGKAKQLKVANRYYGPKSWRAEEDALLRERYPSEGAQVIADQLGRTPLSVHKRACRLKVARQHGAPGSVRVKPAQASYSPAEHEVLRQLYEYAPMQELLAALPGRSSKAIAKQARILGLNRHFHHWPPAHEAVLQAHYATQGAKYVADIIGKTPRQVVSKAAQMGISFRFTPKPPKPTKAPKVKLPKAPKPAKVVEEPILPVSTPNAPAAIPTPLLDARRNAKMREQAARDKDFSITAALKALPPNSEGRRVYMLAARNGGQAGIQAFLSWQQQQAA